MCFCCRVRDLSHARLKASMVQLTTLLLLPIIIALFYLSTVDNAPWFRLAIEKQPHNRASSFSLHSPFAFSFGGIGTHLIQSVVPTEETTDVIDDSSSSNNIMNIQQEDFNKNNNNTSSSPSPSVLFSLERNNSETLVLTVWHLKSVELTIPSFRIHSRTLNLNELSGDPIVQTALSLTGFYQSVIDLRGATDLIYELGEWAMLPPALAIIFLVIWIFISCVKKGSRRWSSSSTSGSYALLQANEDPYRHSSSESHDVISMGTTSSSHHHPGFPSHLPFAVVGALSLVSAVCGIIGLIVWSTHSLVDANRILEGIARLIGDGAANWLSNHSAFQVDIGLIEYVSAVVLLVIVSVVNLLSQFAPKRIRRRSSYDDTQLEYQPPLDVSTTRTGETTLRERSPMHHNRSPMGAAVLPAYNHHHNDFEDRRGGAAIDSSTSTTPTVTMV